MNEWQGGGELLVYRDGHAVPVHLQLHRKPHHPLRPGRWAGAFTTAPFVVLTPGRALLTLATGAEAEVMVEGYDTLTGRGDLFGLDRSPF